MSFEEHAVTAPAGELDLLLLKIAHPTWATPLRYAMDTRNWTIPDDGLYVSTGFDADAAGTDDTGLDLRNISIPDLDFTLWRRLEKLSRIGSRQMVTVTILVYLSTDLTEPAIAPAVLRMSSRNRDGRIVTFAASNADVANRDAPPREFTWTGNPGLRR